MTQTPPPLTEHQRTRLKERLDGLMHPGTAQDHALLFALWQRDLAALRTALDGGANPNISVPEWKDVRDAKRGMWITSVAFVVEHTPLADTETTYGVPALRMLLAAGAKMALCDPLATAVARGSVGMTKTLLAAARMQGLDLNAQPFRGIAFKAWAQGSNGHWPVHDRVEAYDPAADLLGLLVEAGVDPSLSEHDLDAPPLHWCLNEGRPDRTRLLLTQPRVLNESTLETAMESVIQGNAYRAAFVRDQLQVLLPALDDALEQHPHVRPRMLEQATQWQTVFPARVDLQGVRGMQEEATAAVVEQLATFAQQQAQHITEAFGASFPALASDAAVAKARPRL